MDVRAGGGVAEAEHTFLDLVTEQVHLLPAAHAASRPVHPHDLQVGRIRGL